MLTRYSLALVVSTLPTGLMVLACRGSVDRLYEDEPVVLGPDSATPDVERLEPDADASPPPPTSSATIRGYVVGLTGKGLALRNNGGDDIEVAADGPFEFSTKLASDTPYEVTVRSQPAGPTQTCEVKGGTGTARDVDVVVAVTCATNAYPVGGKLVGLIGSEIVLQNNAGNDLNVTANGTFAFTQPVASGSGFMVTIKTQPAGQNCMLSGDTGSVVAAAVESVVVNCKLNAFTVGGTVSGIAGTLTLSNGKDVQTITANGEYAFPTPLSGGATYNVGVKTQPAYPPSAQTCTVTSPTGNITYGNITNVNVACTTNKYTVGGSVTGLTGTGLALRNNGVDDLEIAADGAFTFKTSIPSAGGYAVTVKTHPAGQTCLVSSGAGMVTSANVSSVAVNCAPEAAARF